MIFRSRSLALSLSTIILAACAGSSTDFSAADIEGVFDQGMEYFEKKNWIKAEEAFTFIIYNDPGGAYADDAQLQLAETHFMREEFLLAISEYDRLLSRMPNSPLVEEALWRKTESYYELSPDFRLEKENTTKALRYLYDFIDIYPASEYRAKADEYIGEIRNKLGRKIFESGKLYNTMGEYESAILYFDSVLEEYSDTDYALRAHFAKAESLYLLEDSEAALVLIKDYEDRLPELKEKEQLQIQALKRKIQDSLVSDKQ